jgi:uncharacterized RDD family membrane protein YckC
MVEPAPAATPPGPQDFPATGINSLASIPQRAGGWLLDGLITSVPSMAIVLPFLDLEALSRTGEYPSWVLAVPLGVWIVYQVVLIAWVGRTVGALAVGVRVARYVDGANPRVDQAAMRALLPAAFVPIPVPFLNAGWIVVYLVALNNPLRRGLHDMAGGTVVIRTR